MGLHRHRAPDICGGAHFYRGPSACRSLALGVCTASIRCELRLEICGRKVIGGKRKLQTYLTDGGPMYDFIAQTARAYMHSQQADYKLISKPEGCQLRGLTFVIRPDYQFNY